jgi:hypothetical protein
MVMCGENPPFEFPFEFSGKSNRVIFLKIEKNEREILEEKLMEATHLS